MPDLEKQISEWRRGLAQAVEHHEGLLDELEGHMREEIDRLVRSGTPAAEAFQIAAATFGSPSALAGEFQKLTVASRQGWWPVKIAVGLLALAILCVGGLVLSEVSDERLTMLLASHVLSVTLGYGMTFANGGLGLCYLAVRLFRDLPLAQRYTLRRSVVNLATFAAALTGTGILLGMVWAKGNLGRYWAWDPKETGALLVLSCAIVTTSFRWLPRISTRSLMSVALIGNLATAWAWFGVHILATWSSGYDGRSTHLALGLGFCAVHLVFLAGAFLPANCLQLRKA
jgi:ABC-type transport system involved in cytochrome c biogenesis permease subunit